MCKVIYMFFLMLESGRKAVGELLEPGPDQVQNTIMILLSELVAYGKLLEIYKKPPSFRIPMLRWSACSSGKRLTESLCLTCTEG